MSKSNSKQGHSPSKTPDVYTISTLQTKCSKILLSSRHQRTLSPHSRADDSLLWWKLCQQRNIDLNAAKLQLKLKELKFMGTIISNQGMKPDQDKVEAITHMPQPLNNAALLRFIGMVNYLSPFFANLSSAIQLARTLTQGAVPFIWSIKQSNWSPQSQSSPTMISTSQLYFRRIASNYATGGALLQLNDDGKLQLVVFTSSSINPTEQRYSQ